MSSTYRSTGRWSWAVPTLQMKKLRLIEGKRCAQDSGQKPGLTLSSLAPLSTAGAPFAGLVSELLATLLPFPEEWVSLRGWPQSRFPWVWASVGSAPQSLDAAQTSARQPGTRGTVETTAWVMFQCAHNSSQLDLDLTSLSLSVPTSEGCHEDSLRWHMGNIIVIGNIPHCQDYRFPGSLRSIRAEVPKPDCATETSGEFSKNLCALVPQPSKGSNPGGLGWARGLLFQLFGGFL